MLVKHVTKKKKIINGNNAQQGKKFKKDVLNMTAFCYTMS